MNKRHYSVLFIIYFLTLILGCTYFFNFQVDTNILRSLDQKIYNDEVTDALTLYEDYLTKKVLIVVKTKKSALTLANDLKKRNLYESIEAKFSSEKSKLLYEYYFKHRRKILNLNQIEMIESGRIINIENSAAQKLYNPFNTFSGLFPKDPYLLFQESFRPIQLQSSFDIDDGFLRLKGGGEVGYLVTAQLKVLEDAGFLLSLLQRNENVLNYFSLAFYGVKAKQQAFYESNFFFSLSVFLILLAFFYYFKTSRHVLISIGLISFSFIVALICTTLLVGKIHIITFLLGVSVLGIIADYFIHYFMEETDSLITDASEAMKKIRRPMLYSLATSIIGFTVFRFIPLDVIKQFSVFSVTALLVAFLSVRCLLPIFFVKSNHQSGLSLNEKSFILLKKYSLINYLYLFFVVIVFLQVSNIKVSNDIRQFSSRDVELYKNELKLKEMLKVRSSSELMVVFGKTFQEALENEEKLKERFVAKGIKGSFYSDWFPSNKRQKRSLKSYEILESNLDRFLKKLEIPNTPIIKQNMIMASRKLIEDSFFINKNLAKQNLGQIGDHYYLIVPVLFNNKKVDLRTLSSDSILYYNKLRLIDKTLDDFGNLILKGIVIFYIVAFFILLKRFDLYSSFQILRPTFLSVCVSLCFCSFFYDFINIFHILGLVLIIALGLDFSFFYFFNRAKSSSVGRAVSLSTMTTLSSFGVLSLSSTFAIYSFGIIVLLGIVICWILVPSISVKDFDV